MMVKLDLALEIFFAAMPGACMAQQLACSKIHIILYVLLAEAGCVHVACEVRPRPADKLKVKITNKITPRKVNNVHLL
jgi:hypothetical protein